MLNLGAVFVILVASRSLMTHLRRTALNMIVPFDKAMPAFHSLVGNMLTVATIIHALGHAVRFSVLKLKGPGFFGYTSLAISGSLLTTIMLAMKITALKVVRQRSFETFYWVHSLGFVSFFILLIIHGSHSGSMKTWMYVVGPLVVYLIDRMLRLFREKGSRLVVTKESAVLKGTDMVCLRIPRTFGYLAGQYCDLKVPLVSNLEWHPFTIASSPHESEMLFYIKVSGDWTRKLYMLFKEGTAQDVSIHVRGPYGAPAQHVGQYEHVVLVSGGVGATPFCSITKYAHHWILNYTKRGAEASNSVSAAFTRNQSVRGTPSVPGTPGTGAGYSSSAQRSSNPSRHMSRNQSSNFVANLSRNLSRNASRSMSRSASRNMSRSGSGRLERFNSNGYPQGQRMDRVGSANTTDSVGIIIQEQRQNQPHGPYPVRSASPYRPEGVALTIPGTGITGDDAAMKAYLDNNAAESSQFLPADYDEALGNPELPIPDRRAPAMDVSPGLHVRQRQPQQQLGVHQTFEIVQEYDASQPLFDDEDVENQNPPRNVGPAGSNEYVGNGVLEEGFEFEPMEMGDQGGLELEDQILGEQTTASNAYNMLGMSFGPMAMLRHMHEMDARRMRSSMMRASMNLMDDAMDSAVWQDRLLFYLHSVTINWVLLWLMLVRFAVVAIADISHQFALNQTGLGIFKSLGWDIADLALAIIVTVPVVGAVVMEIYMHGVGDYLDDNIGNSFDLFVLVPLLFACIGLHIMDMAGIGESIDHVSKLTVFAIWPVLSLFLLWRIGRTIGSRVLLAQYFKSTHAQTKSLDYIWVSKTHEDDLWLIDELLPLAGSNIVRLHRFITRHGPKTEPWMLDYEKIPLKTTYSRPDWDDVFGSLVERSKSGTVIGVFFCGPDNMARMIQQSAMTAMTKSLSNAIQRGWQGKDKERKRRSRYRNGGLGDSSRGREEEMGFGQSGSIGQGGVGRMGSRGASGGRGTSAGRSSANAVRDERERDPAAYGCGVRISVRVENFT